MRAAAVARVDVTMRGVPDSAVEVVARILAVTVCRAMRDQNT